MELKLKPATAIKVRHILCEKHGTRPRRRPSLMP